MFEISYTNLQHLTITFEIPRSGTDGIVNNLATLEIDLTEQARIQCKSFTSTKMEMISDNSISKILQRYELY